MKKAIKGPDSVKSEVLSVSEKENLSYLETVIEKNLAGFLDVGEALVKIRNKRLYRSYGTFEAYCRKRWGFERRHAYRLIEAVGVNENVSHGTQTKPSSERQLRPLARLEPEQQKKVWKKAVQTSPGGRVTGRHVQEVVKEQQRAAVGPVVQKSGEAPISPDPAPAPVSTEYPFPISEDFKKAYENFLSEFQKAWASKWTTTSKLAVVRCMKPLQQMLYARKP